MSTEGNGSPVMFKVSFSGKNREVLKQQFREAMDAGKAKAFLVALRQILDRLRRDPRNFGEPMYRLPALKLQVFQGAILPLLVNFAVHDERAIVFIQGIKVLS